MIDKSTTFITILSKKSFISYLGLTRAQMVDATGKPKAVNAVVKLDPREGEPFLKQFDTQLEAVKGLEEAVSTSIDRGWHIVYRGRPMFG